MRTLIANIPLPANRFLVDLNSALERHVDLTHDHDAFWGMAGDFDVVHLHFPEYMTFEIQNAYIHSLTDELIAAIEKRLQYWSERSVLVITRHVLLPHDARSDPRWEKLYETVYRYVDGVVHFAEPSVEEFRKRYAATPFVHGHPAHCVVPHHSYASLPNQISRDEARRQLGIAANAHVLLVFGAIRNDEERGLILNSFRQLRVPGKVLLVSRWRETLAKVSWIRLKYWLRDMTRLYYRIHPQYRFNYGFVEEEDAQLYMNAADVLLIPRLHVLNSGNVTMGMTFGKVVVGPDSLDVGHLLKSTGNVVFDPYHPETAAAAIEQAMELARLNQTGPANQRLALTEWSADQCAAQYFTFFKNLTEKKSYRMKKILVTGGAGFVGRRFCKRYLDAGDQVYCVDPIAIDTGGIDPEQGWPLYSPHDHKNFHFYKEDCRAWFKQHRDDDFDYVFHLAAMVGGRAMIENRPLAVADDLSIDAEYWQWAEKARPTKTVCFSSSAAYPIGRQKAGSYELLTEDMIAFDDDIGMPDMSYGWAKLTCEYLARLAYEKHGLKSVCYRPFSGYGEDQDDTYPFPSICKRAMAHVGESTLSVWGTGDQMRDFIYIEDCVDGVLTTMDKIDDGDALNLSTGIYTSFKQFARMAAEECGYAPEVVGLSDKPAGVFARGGDTRKQAEYGFRYLVEFRDGIRKALRLYQR